MFMKQAIMQASTLIISGELVAIPTETVYGIGANALNSTAVAKIFELKQRPTFDPLIVHIGSQSMLAEVAALPLPPLAQKLIDRFWPGPLSIVVNKSSNIPDLVTAGMPSVAIRMPNHPITLELLNQCQMPIAAPSANMFGAISATTANAVQQEFGSRCPFLLDGGPCSVGLESTVISFLSEPPLLLRPGGIPLEEIQAVIGTVLIPDDQKQQQLSPGRLNSHYAPRTPLYLLEDSIDTLKAKHPQAWAALIAHKKWQSLGPSSVSLAEDASQLFESMRQLDQKNLDFIVAEPWVETGLGYAISDRLKRASSGKIVYQPHKGFEVTAKENAS